MADNSISESQRLLAEIEAKYGRAPSTQPVPQPAQQPAQQAPQPQAKRSVGALEGVMNLFGNRGKQIDKAAGYSLGGSIGGLDQDRKEILGQAALEGSSSLSSSVLSNSNLSGRQKSKALADINSAASAYGVAPVSADISGLSERQKQAQDISNFTSGLRATDASLRRPGDDLLGRQAYGCGGKVKAHAAGGKIQGPGTATSDSIPAKVEPTGEDILVSNGERILSVEQDQLLGRIAQMLGFETVDVMFEQMTGKPVGPTMKDGKPAAADGWSIANDPDEYNKAAPLQGVLPPLFGAQDSKIGPSSGPSIVGKAIDDSLSKTRALQKFDDLPAASYSNEGRSVPSLVTADNPGAVSAPAARSLAQQPAGAPVQQRGRDANGVITADSVGMYKDSGDMGGLSGLKSGGMRIGEGGYNQAKQNEAMAKALGYAGTDDFNKKFRERGEMQEKMAQATALGGNRAALAVLLQGGRAQQHEADPLDTRKKQLEVGGLEEMAALRGKVLAGDKNAAAMLRSLSGKTEREGDFKIAETEVPDPTSPTGFRKVSYVVNNGGADERQVGAQKKPTGVTSVEEIAKARAAGMKDADIIARIKSAGGNPKDYGLQG